MTVIICGTFRECPCCGGDMGDSIGICWDCMAGNFSCPLCLERGVPLDQFSDRSPECRLHRFSHWKEGPESTAVTSCGMEIPYSDIGQGVAVLDECEICWKGSSEG